MSMEHNCRNCEHASDEWSPKYEKNMLFCRCDGMPHGVSFDRRFEGKFCCNQWRPNDGAKSEPVRNADELKERLAKELEDHYQKWGFLSPEVVMGLIDKYQKEGA